MAELPSGTVTFLFTDIEGSTRLLARLRGRYAEVLAQHQRVLRAAFDAYDGREVHTEGDAFFVAFARASDAVAASLAGQRGLASKRWPDGVDVRVRMGVHSGEATVSLDDYVGLDVHRAARICSAGHGGQVLLSSSTRELVADELPEDVELRDLGEHWLKDLDHPEHLFQLVAGDLRRDFPPLGAVSPGPGPAKGLPPSPNRTIGRDDDVRAIAERLCQRSVRLLTLTGAGGVGKTRLALEAARAVNEHFAQGAHFVSLAALQRPEGVPSAIIDALGIVVVSGETARQAGSRFLAAKNLLLVVDNFEHVLAAAPAVGELVGACPRLTVLATSREPLNLQVEERYAVAPLAVPSQDGVESIDALANVDAVALFSERARAHDPGFTLDDDNAAAVAEICRRVDGLPLAVELAASRCELLSPREIAHSLRVTLGAVGAGARDAPARQQSLEATIDWSHDLLSEHERACFARFAVFAGGATIEAAQTITGADVDVLTQLVAKNLLVRREGVHGVSRLSMLETVRQYAAARFAAAADDEAVSARHYRHYLALAEHHGAEAALCGPDGKVHLARLDDEADNLRSALTWAIEQQDAGAALEMCAAVSDYWLMRDRYADGVHWIDQVLGMPGADAHPAPRVRTLCFKARCVWTLGRAAEEPAVLADLEATARGLADPAIVAHALSVRADREAFHGRFDAANRLADEALRCAMTAHDPWEVAMALHAKAMAPSDVTELRQRVDEAVSAMDATGNVYGQVGLLGAAASVTLSLGGDRQASEFVQRAMPTARELNLPYLRILLAVNLGAAALFAGDTEAPRHAFNEVLTLSREVVVPAFSVGGFLGLAGLAALEGEMERAARLAGVAAAQRREPSADAVDRRLEITFLEPARAQHGAEAWDAMAREGATLSFEDAIAYALQEDGEDVRTHREAVT